MKNQKPNLSKGGQKAMEKLPKRKDIIITNPEKGVAVVKIGVERYINETNRQLSDKHNYKTLQKDTALQNSNLVKNTIDRLEKENLLSKKLAERLKFVNLKPPRVLISSKIHRK